jgi:ComF family protein
MAILSSDQVKMTSVLEKIVDIIAPHRCIICSNYNNVVCESCVRTLSGKLQPFCVFCGGESYNWQPCNSCSPATALTHAYVCASYSGQVKELIRRFKFEHARDAYKPVAALLVSPLPAFNDEWAVVPVPTVSAHIRERSYDHTLLIAKQVAKALNMPLERPLERSKNVRQVGADRKARLAVAESIAVRRPLAAKRILLIDDVCTTGATLNACAQRLVALGVVEVRAAVAAWQSPRPDTKKDR